MKEIKLTFTIEDFNADTEKQKDMNSEYPLLIRCTEDSEYDTYNKGDIFAARLDNMGHDPETTAEDWFDLDFYDVKPVVCFGKCIFVECAEVIATLN